MDGNPQPDAVTTPRVLRRDWGASKDRLAARIAARTPRRDRDLARAVLGAIVAGDRSRAARSAADRLAERRDHPFGTAREALRREWPSTDGPELLLLRDATGALSSPAGVDLTTELLATLPAERTIALSTRTPLPPALAQLFEGPRTESVDPTADSARACARRGDN